VRAQPLLDGPAGEQLGSEGAVGGAGAPVGDAVAGVVDDGEGAVGAAGDRPGALTVDLDDDLFETGEGEQQRVVDRPQQPFGEVGGGGVAQRQDDGGVVRVRGGALGGERQPQQRYVTVAPPDLVPEAGAVPGGLGGQLPRLGQRPPHAAVPADDGGLVGDGEDGGEPDAEPPDGLLVGLPLRRRAQGGQRLDPGRVQRRAGVGGDEHTVTEGEPQPSGHPGPGRRVGGVLREFDDEPVPIAPEDQVLLGVGVLPEPGGAGGPGVQHSTPQTCRTERIGTLGGGPHELAAHVPSPHRREDEGTACGAGVCAPSGSGRLSDAYVTKSPHAAGATASRGPSGDAA
jgi:hypothetical protein